MARTKPKITSKNDIIEQGRGDAGCHFLLMNTNDDRIRTASEKHEDYYKQYTFADYIERALKISTFEELFSFAFKVKRDYGCSAVGGCMGFKQAGGTPTVHYFCGIDKSHQEWAWHYRKNLLAIDPIVFYAKDNVIPMAWRASHDLIELEKTAQPMANAIADFGVKGYLMFPTHGQSTLISGFRFGMMRGDSLDKSDIDNRMPFLSLISSYMHEAFERILSASRNAGVVLTAREREIIRWAACGLTSWEISDKLNISENTVLTHMKRIHLKLEVKTRQHAVARAISLGLITI